MIAANNSYLLAFDNLPGLPHSPMLSAGLPLAAASAVRQLSTDAAIDIWPAFS